MRKLVVLVLALSAPAQAEWKAANPAVAEAAKNARVAAVLAEVTRIDEAIVAGNRDGFVSRFGKDAVVNNPFNAISDAAEAGARFQSGAISYEYLRRSIEYAAPRREDEVVLMGEESYKPRAGAPHAGKVVRRRFTDLWRRESGGWKLSLRQATIISAE